MSVETRLDEAREKLSKAREVARKRGAHSDELAKAAKEMREVIADKRGNRQDLDEVKDEAQRERIADKIEELEAEVDRVVDRLDRSKRRSKAANEELAKHGKRVERLRKRREEREEAEDRPSENFAWAEFGCNDGTPAPVQSHPAIEAWCRDIGEPARERFGAVHINSAFRHRTYNASIGGEPNSVHIYDYPGRNYQAVAVDWTAANGNAAEWFAFTAGKADGRGRYATFHHSDNRNRIGWSDAVWSG